MRSTLFFTNLMRGACGFFFFSAATLQLPAQVALLVESNRKSLIDDPAALAKYSDLVADTMSVILQGSKYDKDRTKGVMYVMMTKAPTPAIIPEAKLAAKAPYRILYREDVSDKKAAENTSRSTGRILQNGIDIGRGREKTTTVIYTLKGDVTLEFQKWDGTAYQRVAQWSGEVGEHRSTRDSVASGQGLKFDSGSNGSVAKISDPPTLDHLLWKGFLQAEIVPGKLDKKTETLDYKVKVTNISPWPLMNFEIELRQAYETKSGTDLKSDRSFKPQRPAPVLQPGASLDVPASIKLVSPKRLGDASIHGAAFNFEIQ